MAGYSVGDRVKVLWNDGPYNATVVKVYSHGAVDVTHDLNDSVGVFLTAKEHGLKLLSASPSPSVCLCGCDCAHVCVCVCVTSFLVAQYLR